MTLAFESRPYGGKTFRPRPETLLDRETGLLIVATPWGPRATAKSVIDRMRDYILTAQHDTEATSPFGRLSSLSTSGNLLRTAAMLANEAVLREENRTEYRAGVELFAASFADHEFAWVQLGSPQPLLARQGRHSLSPLGPQIDLSFEMSVGEKALPSLPSQLLGLDAATNLFVGSIRAKAGDKVCLVSSSVPADSLYRIPADQTNLDEIAKILANDHPDDAFWIGLLHLDDRKLSLPS